jgi:hypothetical protein
MNQRQIVIVEWNDAHTTELDELKPDEIETELHFSYHTTSYGLLLQSDERGVSLCTDLQQGQDGAVHYRCAHFIPRGMVRSERVIPAPKAGKPYRAAKHATRRKKVKATQPVGSTADPAASTADPAAKGA